MRNSRTPLCFMLAATLLANPGGALASDPPTAESASTDARVSTAARAERDGSTTVAADPADRPASAASDVKAMVEDEVRLQLSQRLAAFSPPS